MSYCGNTMTTTKKKSRSSAKKITVKRRPRPSEQVKKLFTIWLTPAERKLLAKMTKKAGCETIADYVRSKVFPKTKGK